MAAGADCAALQDALRQAQALRWRYQLAQTELERLRVELSRAQESQEQQLQRRTALIEAVADSVPSAMLSSRRQGWNEGWEASQMGLPKSANPHRDHGDPDPGPDPGPDSGPVQP